jgi:hypothetical protein
MTKKNLKAVWVDEKTHAKIKVKAAEGQTTMRDIVTKGVECLDNKTTT